MYWLSTHMETPDSYFFFFLLAKIQLVKTCAFYLEQTEGITSQSGEKKTVKPVFLWMSSFSSPWRSPHSEAGAWSHTWTESGESTGWTLSLHLWHCTHRGPGKSLQTSHKSQDCLKSSTLHCHYPTLYPTRHMSQSNQIPGASCAVRITLFEKSLSQHDKVIHTHAFELYPQLRCFLGLTDYKESFPL